MIIKAKFVLLFLLAITTMIVAVIGNLFLPSKYFFDALLIVNDTFNEKALIGSYPFSMWFYHYTGLGKLPFVLVGLIQIPIIFWALKRLGLPDTFYKLRLRNIIIWLTILLFGIYLAIPSKEFINLLWMSLIGYVLVAPLKLKIKVFWAISLFVFFGLWFRTYYILVPVLGCFLYLFSRIKIKNKIIINISLIFLVTCFLSLAFGLIKGEFMTGYFRERINSVRVGREDSQTIITSPVKPDDPLSESISIAYGFFSVNIPVNGLRFFKKPQVLSFIIWQLALFGFILYFYHKCLNNRNIYNHEEWVFHFLFSYLIIQGIFEPDLGSAVKHKLGVFPLIYLAMYFDQGLLSRYAGRKKYII